MTTPSWIAGSGLPTAAPLPATRRTEVCVVGAGIAGLVTAYLLAREGRAVVVLEQGAVAGGETHRSTAQLVTALDHGWTKLVRHHGADGARLAAASHAVAIDRLETILHDEQIACDWARVDGWLTGNPDDPTAIDFELAAARAADVHVERMARAPLGAVDTGTCLRFPAQAQLDPVALAHGLVAALGRLGVAIHGDTHVAGFDGGAPARVVTAHGPAVVADAVVLATNSPIHDALALHPKQAAYRTYVVAAPVPTGAVPHALFWDMAEPFHYVRLAVDRAAGSQLLLVGGEDHKTGQEDDPAAMRWARLEAWGRSWFPMMGPVAHRWSGQVMESMDGLAFIGRTETRPDVYVVTGDSGNGITHGVIAGMLLTDLLQERPNPWAALYDPSRLRVRAAGALVRENLNVAAQLTSWVRGGTADSADDVPPCGGAIVRRGLTKVAVHRDAAGVVHEMSAVCPHLRCIVSWNGAEQSWDCPCHGSRFDATGHVLAGPARDDLEPV